MVHYLLRRFPAGRAPCAVLRFRICFEWNGIGIGSLARHPAIGTSPAGMNGTVDEQSCPRSISSSASRAGRWSTRPSRRCSRLPVQARGLPPGQDDDAQEAELGAPEGGAGPALQRQGSHRVHRRRRAQPPGTLDRPGPRRPRPRPAGRPLPHRPRRPRQPRRGRPQAGPLQVRGPAKGAAGQAPRPRRSNPRRRPASGPRRPGQTRDRVDPHPRTHSP